MQNLMTLHEILNSEKITQTTKISNRYWHWRGNIQIYVFIWSARCA